KPATEEKPEVEEKAAAEEKPEVAEEPAVVEEPKAAEAPKAAEKPEATTESPVAEEPEPKTEKPEVAEEPSAPEAGPETETPQPEPTSKTEAQPTAEPEAPAETEPEPTPAQQQAPEATKPESEPTPDVKPEAETTPEPTPTADAKPEADGEAKPEGKPKAKAEPKDEAAPAPAAADADGAQAPQGPPAPDNESRTGGAGGNDTAEAEGEAEPALPLTALKKHAPGLATAYKAAATALKKHNLTGTRAKVYLVLDRSASMRPYYKDGSAQALAEQTLALAAHLDPEATVPVVFFSTELDGTGEITLTEHENKIDDLHAGLGRMGRTSYHAAVEAVLAHHSEEATGTPALVIFQTDGAPDAKTPATQALTDAARTHPAVFFSFVAFGDPENKAFDYLRKLKTPNTSHFLAGETPRELTDKELYEGVLANWRP
ncbi:VWA domain-containing protein, partial [Streptomyces sp. NRRL S-481]|uniref:VWA domain-containing protein n=1 Tax=Streptomyces sp. NRRL S-481 TaxID=1463911 RepID=UPI00056CA979